MYSFGQTSFLVLAILVLILKTGNSFKILIPGPLFRGRGHTTILSALCADLTSRGHEVTILVPSDDHLKIGEKFANSNATEILEYKTVPVPESDLIKSFRAGDKSSTGAYDTALIFVEVSAEQVNYCRQLLSNDQIMNKLKASNFDLMIEDMGNVCDALLPEILQVPFVALTASTTLPLMNYRRYGFPMELSYFKSPLQLVDDKPMSFLTRAKNVFVRLIIPPFIETCFSRQFRLLQEEFKISPDVDVVTLGHKAQFWLVHDSYMLEAPHPGMPNWRQIGGMAAARPQSLPLDFAEFADGSGDEDGFIVFSPGSIVASFDPNHTALIASVFNRLSQRVFWKNDAITPAGLGNNIMVSSWLPQNDLLSHPKARLFIGHGGLNGIYEALYHGVPMILIPQMLGSQTANAQRVVNKGYGVLLPKKDLTAEALEIRIHQILSNASFSENVRRCSLILQDDDPMDRGVYWIEHVLKFGGGYLRAEVFNLNFVQYYLLDVYAIFLCVIIMSALAVYFSCVLCCSVRRRCSKSKDYPDKNSKVD